MEDGKAMSRLNVLYEDNHIIVVEKPVNILSQDDQTGDISLLSMVKSYIKEKYHKPGEVYCGLLHRLDRPVGGVMVFARTSKAASRLSKEMSSSSFQKKYFAVVSGIVADDRGTLIDYLKKLNNGNTIVTDEKEGKRSELSFHVLERNYNKNQTLVEIELKTGRHHQIRVQFANYGYPLCGDQRYYLQDKTQIALYAYSLSFIHPVKKEKMTFCLTPTGHDYWTNFTMSKYVKIK